MDEFHATDAPNPSNHIAWSRHLLRTVRNVSLSTHSLTKWPSQVLIANGFSSYEGFSLIWWSWPHTQHSRNLEKNNRATVVVGESSSSHPSIRLRLLVQSFAYDNATTVLPWLNKCRSRFNIDPRQPVEFKGQHSKRIYIGMVASEVEFSAPQIVRGEHVGDTYCLIDKRELIGFEVR